MEAFIAMIPVLMNNLVNWVKAGTKTTTQASGTASKDDFLSGLLNSFEKGAIGFAEGSIQNALSRMFTAPGAETPFERDIEYQGAVSGEIGDMKRLADMTLKSLPASAGETASWIQNKFNEQAGILASGQRNVADPGLFKGTMERLMLYFKGSASDGVPASAESISKVTSELQSWGVPISPKGITSASGDPAMLYDIMNSLFGGVKQPFSTVPTAGGSEKILYTAPIVQAAPDYTPFLLLAAGGVVLFLIFKKGGK